MAYENYINRKEEIECLIDVAKKMDSRQKELICKLLLLNVVTLFDAFVCEIIISKITSSEDSFNSFYEKFYDDLTTNKKTHFNKLSRGMLEREVLMSLLMKSFANVERINHIFKIVWNLDLNICEGRNLQEWFDWRHRIVHRNGREKDGKYHQFNFHDVNNALSDIDTTINYILNIISKR